MTWKPFNLEIPVLKITSGNPMSDFCLVRTSADETRIARLVVSLEGADSNPRWMDDNGGYFCSLVTHWMPLPEAPK